MKTINLSLVIVLITLMSGRSLADSGGGGGGQKADAVGGSGGNANAVYGTLVHKDGTMTVIMRDANSAIISYSAEIGKDGSSGGCNRETKSAYQLRQAYTRAKSQWKIGYVPRKFQCED